jgi:hypothetical protein
MSIKRGEAQLARLDAKIQTCQAELAELKTKRKEVKAWLASAKKAAKLGLPLPPSGESEGLAGRIGAVLSESVIEPIAELINPAPRQVEAGSGGAAANVG